MPSLSADLNVGLSADLSVGLSADLSAVSQCDSQCRCQCRLSMSVSMPISVAGLSVAFIAGSQCRSQCRVSVLGLSADLKVEPQCGSQCRPQCAATVPCLRVVSAFCRYSFASAVAPRIALLLFPSRVLPAACASERSPQASAPRAEAPFLYYNYSETIS